jgi:hypothetical protein
MSRSRKKVAKTNHKPGYLRKWKQQANQKLRHAVKEKLAKAVDHDAAPYLELDEIADKWSSPCECCGPMWAIHGRWWDSRERFEAERIKCLRK